ncbi:MAG: oxidoreductase [Gloeobacteraceae cyanobacterium ES-bin-316]|nr:oxidoreductase [Ferruginibacter sp.]
MKNILFALVLLCCYSVNGQTVELLTTGSKTSLRGLSVVDDKTIWVSGSNGTVGRSLDAGKSWTWMIVKGFEKTDFRDIEAFDKTSAVIMGIGEPAYILRTNDGGNSWQVVFENKNKGMFLDAMEFWNLHAGTVIGDPINGRFFIARTFDGGHTWQGIPEKLSPVADSGEACFASSGTNIRKLSKKESVYITGGLVSNVYVRDQKIKLPLIAGKESTGANSIAIKSKKIWIVVGGDFNTKDATEKNAAITLDAGKTWTYPSTAPTGYRSCVEYLKKKQWITCGLNGVDISNDEGINFLNISKEGFHVVRKAKKGKAVYFAGGGGRIGRLKW